MDPMGNTQKRSSKRFGQDCQAATIPFPNLVHFPPLVGWCCPNTHIWLRITSRHVLSSGITVDGIKMASIKQLDSGSMVV
jgi:hypothetical protein